MREAISHSPFIVALLTLYLSSIVVASKRREEIRAKGVIAATFSIIGRDPESLAGEEAQARSGFSLLRQN
ncbi:hypothetical protein QV65_04830 [Rhodococcus erythropolis]|nr:hypothetical protein QV65_04830 [Rhodococcus erythropolis]